MMEPGSFQCCSVTAQEPVGTQNHRVVGVGRDLCGSSSPTPLPKQGHLQQAAQDRRFPLNIRKCFGFFFTVRVTEHWHRLPTGCGVFILGRTLKLSGHGPEQLALGDPASGSGWTRQPPEVPSNLNLSLTL